MRQTDDLRNSDHRHIIPVLIGDGKTEKVLVEPIAEKHNGSTKILFLPSTPIRWEKRNIGRQSGLSALEAVKIYFDKYKLAQTLFLVDKEHFENSRDIPSSLRRALREFGIRIRRVEDLGNQAFLIEGSIGGCEISVDAVIFGKEKCIEENIAVLINLDWELK
jgi:hypothetical protein